jgi:putative intracellular protease/amidase
MFDFRRRDVAALVAQFYDSGCLVSAVCHGPAGLIEVRLDNGEPLVNGKDVTGFS